VAAELGLPATMERVFMTYTGRSLVDDIGEDDKEDNED
jgi:hypothetical protein